MPTPIAAAGPPSQPDARSAIPLKSNEQLVAPVSKQEGARMHLNASIIEASLTISVSSQNEPLALLFKSAIESLNDTLKADFGENAIQNATNQDNTPEGTAGRIVALSTGFFEAFRRQHPGEDETDLLKKFMSTIRQGVDTGFKEARDILQGLKVLEGDVAGNIDKTYDLVQKGYADFEAARANAPSDTAEKAKT